MLLTPELYPADDTVVLQGGELFLSAFGNNGYRLSKVFIRGVEVSHRPCFQEAIDDNGVAVGRVYLPPEMDITLRLTGVGGIMNELSRKETLRRLCAGMSVNELLGVISHKLDERAKKS